MESWTSCRPQAPMYPRPLCIPTEQKEKKPTSYIRVHGESSAFSISEYDWGG